MPNAAARSSAPYAKLRARQHRAIIRCCAPQHDGARVLCYAPNTKRMLIVMSGIVMSDKVVDVITSCEANGASA